VACRASRLFCAPVGGTSWACSLHLHSYGSRSRSGEAWSSARESAGAGPATGRRAALLSCSAIAEPIGRLEGFEGAACGGAGAGRRSRQRCPSRGVSFSIDLTSLRCGDEGLVERSHGRSGRAQRGAGSSRGLRWARLGCVLSPTRRDPGRSARPRGCCGCGVAHGRILTRSIADRDGAAPIQRP
jgi:hypothetical protein